MADRYARWITEEFRSRAASRLRAIASNGTSIVVQHGIVETTSYGDENRTFWGVRVDGEMVRMGETLADVAGIRAYEAATAWAQANAIEIVQWKHWNAGENSRAGRKSP